MKHHTTLVALTLTSVLALAACGGETGTDTTTTTATSETTTTTSAAETPTGTSDTTTPGSTMHGGPHGAHDHPAHGGQPPAGIQTEENPTYPVGSQVILTADHMPGMDGAEATISGAFDTTVYSVSFIPRHGGEPVTDHRWVVHEELVNPGEAPLPDGTQVVLDAGHMSGMQGAEATIDYSTQETVYMVDLTVDGMHMTNHKWVTESEIMPAG
ncbi:hypothetical protein HMPREF0290_0522 [Corynebacterium efficiens YS-314]|uniref:DUF1541 domain-containing protein n=1 Tax=Corynebacterium efficiens (strain DSM 44549 / YS-314 / AJ 12310 / JCM 11189 / NBRC 100395) TaxID=196164 RepID=Q8FTU6_COREF|nr:YdhK family protein [Corynebacterium efficiens]EEW50870.1 hypothetical protein HMPREF0290_0522 [Corynebacterium efficiens YS-314]BAC17092.1 hypothetical protein [Corynebacterium efficiens YS-314]